MRGFWKLTLTAVLTTAALTACGSQETPAADPAPSTDVGVQMPAPPQVTVAAPTDSTGGDAEGVAEAPQATESNPTASDPANNTAPITPVDPARYSAYGNQVGWKSPSGNIYCKIGDIEFSSGCQAADAPIPDGANCVTPSFTIDQLGKGFYMTPGKVTPTCFNQGEFGVENAQPLEYNTSITFNGFTCFSRVEAMICDAGGGHGFVLSMQQATSN
ncbi:hypothetical protein R3P93_18150 [Rhodococcus cerastii]|uniref:Lipoprotein n=1 Tax=Rhodococcus cerastii TaxID=908616 RepID=A0ABU4D5C4_9NOCA|nr:hypothetical protein [Rhodococcus cerastii]MDV6304487.1 hypothetical protein [Rhodococcus cerastii]MDV8057924.1 hypothetical protein [Rhodococcus sp. IEGM 1343]